MRVILVGALDRALLGHICVVWRCENLDMAHNMQGHPGRWWRGHLSACPDHHFRHRSSERVRPLASSRMTFLMNTITAERYTMDTWRWHGVSLGMWANHMS